MPISEATKLVSRSLVSLVMGRAASERVKREDDYRALRAAFRMTYGELSWRLTFRQIVDAHGLSDYIFDEEELLG